MQRAQPPVHGTGTRHNHVAPHIHGIVHAAELRNCTRVLQLGHGVGYKYGMALHAMIDVCGGGPLELVVVELHHVNCSTLTVARSPLPAACISAVLPEWHDAFRLAP